MRERDVVVQGISWWVATTLFLVLPSQNETPKVGRLLAIMAGILLGYTLAHWAGCFLDKKNVGVRIKFRELLIFNTVIVLSTVLLTGQLLSEGLANRVLLYVGVGGFLVAVAFAGSCFVGDETEKEVDKESEE